MDCIEKNPVESSAKQVHSIFRICSIIDIKGITLLSIKPLPINIQTIQSDISNTNVIELDRSCNFLITYFNN